MLEVSVVAADVAIDVEGVVYVDVDVVQAFVAAFELISIYVRRTICLELVFELSRL